MFLSKLILEQRSRIFIGIQKYLACNKLTSTMSGIQSKITSVQRSRGF